MICVAAPMFLCIFLEYKQSISHVNITLKKEFYIYNVSNSLCQQRPMYNTTMLFKYKNIICYVFSYQLF